MEELKSGVCLREREGTLCAMVDGEMMYFRCQIHISTLPFWKDSGTCRTRVD